MNPADAPEDLVADAAAPASGESAESEESAAEPTYIERDTAGTVAEWLGGKPLGRSAHHIMGLVLPLITAFATMWRLRSFTIDDAYISYRYSRNLAKGLGLVYNAGERIEGYTNFSWTVLLALGAKLGVDPAVTAKVLGFAFGLAAIALVYHLETRLRPMRRCCVWKSMPPGSTPWTGAI